MSHRLTRHSALLIATLAVPAVALAQGAPPAAAPASPPAASPTGAAPGAPPGAPTATRPRTRANASDQMEQRIAAMHKELKITPAQEPQWGQLASVMRDNAASMRASAGTANKDYRTMSAEQNMQNYAQMMQMQAQNMQREAEALSKLYQSMTPDQQKAADAVVRRELQPRYRFFGGNY